MSTRRSHYQTKVQAMLKVILPTIVLSTIALTSPAAQAMTASELAGRIVRNCDYDSGIKPNMMKSFTAGELRSLRIAISIDDAVCQQTYAYLNNPKVNRKASQRFVQDVVQMHRDAFDEAGATD